MTCCVIVCYKNIWTCRKKLHFLSQNLNSSPMSILDIFLISNTNYRAEYPHFVENSGKIVFSNMTKIHILAKTQCSPIKPIITQNNPIKPNIPQWAGEFKKNPWGMQTLPGWVWHSRDDDKFSTKSNRPHSCIKLTYCAFHMRQTKTNMNQRYPGWEEGVLYLDVTSVSSVCVCVTK